VRARSVATSYRSFLDEERGYVVLVIASLLSAAAASLQLSFAPAACLPSHLRITNEGKSIDGYSRSAEGTGVPDRLPPQAVLTIFHRPHRYYLLIPSSFFYFYFLTSFALR
jgi:hypothetical protein